MRNKYMDKYIDELVQKYKKERIKRWKENCSAYFRELNPPREFHVFDDEVNKFLRAMKLVHYSECVITNYRRYLNRFDSYCLKHQITAFSYKEAEEFIETRRKLFSSFYET